jgi:hypothetical protein
MDRPNNLCERHLYLQQSMVQSVSGIRDEKQKHEG